MNEKPFFFPNSAYNLFGILHEPVNEGKGEGFVFCHAFAEEKLWSHRVLVNFARELSQLGYWVFRFDYMGHGDSDGKFHEATVETRLSDIRCAIAYLKERMGNVQGLNVLGLRFGATLAAEVAEVEPDINRLILWDPIIDGSKYMKQLLRINLSTQTAVFKKIKYNSDALIDRMKNGKTVNIEGYEIAWPFFKTANAINLLKQQKNYSGKVLLVQISKRESPINKNNTELAQLYQHCEALLTVEDFFWKEIRSYYARAENLYKISLDWLRQV